jgi:hypothetical protein
LVDVAVVTERAMNQSLGLGFVTYATSTADTATQEYERRRARRRTIWVNRAEELPAR